jgi:ATP-dependent 26S proteasome regulatory subunit
METFDKSMLRMSILSYMKTDNVMVDILLAGLLMAIMNKMMEWCFKFKMGSLVQKSRQWFRFNCWGRHCNEIILVRHEFISTSAWDNRGTYPKSILAIYNYIRKKNLVQNGSIKHIENKHIERASVWPATQSNYQIESCVEIQVTPGVFFKTYWDEEGRLVSDNNKGERMVEHKYSLFSYTCTVTQLMAFLTQCIEELESDTVLQLNTKPCYFMYNSKSDGMLHFDEYSLEHDRTFDNIFLDQKAELKERLDFFQQNRSWYRAKGIPYTLGIMFSGKPGCGKTSTIKSIAKYTNRHVIDVSLSKIDNCRDLMQIFYSEEINGKKIPMHKRIYLFEDIDSILDVLKERSAAATATATAASGTDSGSDIGVVVDLAEIKMLLNAEGGGGGGKKLGNKGGAAAADKLNLGFFLNLLDGVLETPGRILIISTNYPEKLDRALVRPGRVDLKIHMDKCSPGMIRDIFKHYYSTPDEAAVQVQVQDDVTLIAALYAKELTPAELYQICFKYKTYAECVQDLRENLDTIFDKYINRTEEQWLKEQKQSSLQRCSGRPARITHRKKQQQQYGEMGGREEGGGGGTSSDDEEINL